jgi:hypothetical protein
MEKPNKKFTSFLLTTRQVSRPWKMLSRLLEPRLPILNPTRKGSICAETGFQPAWASIAY